MLNKRELETTLVVDDGDIAVAGGLLDQNDRLAVDAIPGLGQLPVIGGLFRSTTRQRGRTNLMVFIRPTIIRSAADAQTLAADRWGYMRQQQLTAVPDREPSLDEMLRDYMRAQPPVAPSTMIIAPDEVTAAPLPPVLRLNDTAGIAAFIRQWYAAAMPVLRGLVLAGGRSERMQTDKGA